MDLDCWLKSQKTKGKSNGSVMFDTHVHSFPLALPTMMGLCLSVSVNTQYTPLFFFI